MKEMLKRSATAIGGRNGIVKDTESGMTYTLRKPVEMGGTDQPGTDPEELFSAGYASCLASSIEHLLIANKTAYNEVSVEAKTSLMMVPNKGFHFHLTVKTRIIGVTSEVEAEYVKKGQAFCPFSRAIKGNVTVENI